jgi:hypothetical protein
MWRIAKTSYGGVEGYASRVSARVGDTITLYVSTTAPVFRVEAYRMGWYQGLGGRLAWRSPEVPAKVQPAPSIIARTRTVTAVWEPSLRVDVSKDWVPGDYLLKLVARNGQSYVPLTVRNDSSRSPVLVMNAVTTWQAYNGWGIYNLYFGPGGDARRRSTVVSFDRPYAWGSHAQPSNACCDFVTTELGIVALVERMGLDVTYTTDVDVDENPEQLLRHKVVISPGHDEYWSVAKRDAVENARDHGVNLMFLGPNPAYWRIRLAPSRLGARRLEVNYRVARDDPLYGKDDRHVTRLWRSAPQPQPESSLTGVVFYCFDAIGDGVVTDPSSWVFAGTGLKEGDRIRGLVQGEADHVDARYDTPANVEKLMHSPVTCAGIGKKRLGLDGRLFSDTTYYTVPSGAGVFSTGSAWVCWLYEGCPVGTRGGNRVVQQITENVIRAFAGGPAGRTHPAKDPARRSSP